VEAERVPFGLGKGRTLVEPRMDEQIVSGESRFHQSVAVCALQSSTSCQPVRDNLPASSSETRQSGTVSASTASSDAVLPAIMRKLERMGIKDTTVGLVIPTGYSFNLDGFSIYLTLAVVFIAQATNTPLSVHDLALVLLISLITSKGAHGIPGSAIVILAATLKAIPAIPVVGLVLILPIDWFVGIGRAVTNLIGNCVATVVIASWERDIDSVRAQAVLDGEVLEEVSDVPGREMAPS
jgi:aerobic C4-dicarboxylate transport protein